MNDLSRTVRLIAAAASAAITFGLLGTVYAIAEPQRGVLLAKLERAQQPAAASGVAVAMASTAGAPTAK